ncbi:MAG: hypothetical protein NXI32_22745 [bacterium]|nr:hypothetical protein [bacterium]
MPFSDDDLIAFLLDDISPELKQAIDAALRSSSDLQDRLMFLRQMLGHMDDLAGSFEPPGDLVESTMERIDAIQSASQPQPARAPALALRTATVGGGSSHGLLDSFVLCLSLAVLCCLILPSIVSARFRARIAQCSANLQQVGGQMLDFTMHHPEHRFPQVGVDERTGFAGIYPVLLKSAGYSPEYARLQCPSLIGLRDVDSAWEIRTIPSIQQLQTLAYPEIVALKYRLGGDYAYGLGVLEDGTIVAPRCEGRSSFAVLADAPIFDDTGERFLAHQGQGINIFYEDGRVEFLRMKDAQTVFQGRDNPFRNDRGAHAVGLGPGDSSLAPSPISPFGPTNEDYRLLLQ